MKTLNLIKTLIILTISTLFIIGCGGGGGGSTSSDSTTTVSTLNVGGTPTKGPFTPGTIVKVIKLNDDGTETDTYETTTIGSDHKFTFENLTWSGPAKFIVEDGEYYNEATGGYSNGTLRAIENIEEGTPPSVNINILTEIATDAILEKMSNGTSINEAKEEVKNLIANKFNIDLPDGSDLEDIDLTDGSTTSETKKANAQLLLLSTAFLKTDNQDELLSTFSEDLIDGELGSEGTIAFSNIQENIENIDFDEIASIMEASTNLVNTPTSDFLNGTLSLKNNFEFNSALDEEIYESGETTEYIQTSLITVYGIYGSEATIEIENGEYAVNSWFEYTDEPGVIQNGDTLIIRQKRSSEYGTQNITTLNVGGTEVEFLTTTKNAPIVEPTEPDTEEPTTEEPTTEEPTTEEPTTEEPTTEEPTTEEPTTEEPTTEEPTTEEPTTEEPTTEEPTNNAPRIVYTIPNVVLDEEQSLNINLTPSFSDLDEGDTIILSAKLSNGNSLPSWLSFSNGTLVGTPLSSDAGTISLTITAKDNEGLTASQTFSINVNAVNDSPVVVSYIYDTSIEEDSSFTLDVKSSFSDPDTGDSLTYTSRLSNGSILPSWLNFSNGEFSGTPSNSDVGSSSIKVTAKDEAGLSVSQTFLLTVTNVNDSPRIVSFISDQTLNAKTSLSLSVTSNFSDSDIGDVLTYSAKLSDGNSLPSWLSFSNGIFSGTPSNSDAGSIDVKVTVTDNGGLTTNQSFYITVIEVEDETPTETGTSLTTNGAQNFYFEEKQSSIKAFVKLTNEEIENQRIDFIGIMNDSEHSGKGVSVQVSIGADEIYNAQSDDLVESGSLSSSSHVDEVLELIMSIETTTGVLTLSVYDESASLISSKEISIPNYSEMNLGFTSARVEVNEETSTSSSTAVGYLNDFESTELVLDTLESIPSSEVAVLTEDINSINELNTIEISDTTMTEKLYNIDYANNTFVRDGFSDYTINVYSDNEFSYIKDNGEEGIATITKSVKMNNVKGTEYSDLYENTLRVEVTQEAQISETRTFGKIINPTYMNGNSEVSIVDASSLRKAFLDGSWYAGNDTKFMLVYNTSYDVVKANFVGFDDDNNRVYESSSEVIGSWTSTNNGFSVEIENSSLEYSYTINQNSDSDYYIEETVSRRAGAIYSKKLFTGSDASTMHTNVTGF